MSLILLALIKRTVASLVAICLLGCGGGSSGGSGAAAPSGSCTPSSSYYAPVSSWTLTANSSLYDLQLTIDRSKLDQFKAWSSGCSVSKYEVSVVDGSKFIIFNTDPRPTIIATWRTIGPTDFYSFTGLNLSGSTYISICFRAFSQLSEESSWYCSNKAVSSGSSTPTTTTTTTTLPLDTSPPSTPTNLAISTYWSTSNMAYLQFTGSSDAQSGIARYWSAILDSTFNQISPDKELSKFATSDSFDTSSLSSGRTYNYALLAENGAGLLSQMAYKSFYKPLQVTVYLKYSSIDSGGCYYPTTYACQTAAKTMFDTQLSSLKANEYSTCTLTSLGGNSYEINCRTAQNCRVTPIGGYCNGVPATQYSGYCGAVSGVYVSGSCGASSWLVTLPNP